MSSDEESLSESGGESSEEDVYAPSNKEKDEIKRMEQRRMAEVKKRAKSQVAGTSASTGTGSRKRAPSQPRAAIKTNGNNGNRAKSSHPPNPSGITGFTPSSSQFNSQTSDLSDAEIAAIMRGTRVKNLANSHLPVVRTYQSASSSSSNRHRSQTPVVGTPNAQKSSSVRRLLTPPPQSNDESSNQSRISTNRGASRTSSSESYSSTSLSPDNRYNGNKKNSRVLIETEISSDEDDWVPQKKKKKIPKKSVTNSSPASDIPRKISTASNASIPSKSSHRSKTSPTKNSRDYSNVSSSSTSPPGKLRYDRNRRNYAIIDIGNSSSDEDDCVPPREKMIIFQKESESAADSSEASESCESPPPYRRQSLLTSSEDKTDEDEDESPEIVFIRERKPYPPEESLANSSQPGKITNEKTQRLFIILSECYFKELRKVYDGCASSEEYAHYKVLWEMIQDAEVKYGRRRLSFKLKGEKIRKREVAKKLIALFRMPLRYSN